MSNKAIFIDKDGTLIHNVPYNVDPSKITFYPDAPALKELVDAGYLLIVISNQSGVARGLFEEKALFMVKKTVEETLTEYKIKLTEFYYCPHHPEGKVSEYAVNCNCRKPNPGMFFQAAREHDVDLKKSWMLGDVLHDVEAGHRAGCRSILINRGHEIEWRTESLRQPFTIVDNLGKAVEVIKKMDEI